MRKLILQEFVTIDGRVAGPNGETDFVMTWANGNKDMEVDALRFIEAIDVILLGRVTYEMFAEYWPKQTKETDFISEKMNTVPKVVFSKTLDSAPWGDREEARLVKTDAADEIRKLKEQSGKDMVMWGSISLAQSLMKEKLVDEYQFRVCRVVLGKGRTLFPDDLSFDMQLLESKAYADGAVTLCYRPS